MESDERTTGPAPHDALTDAPPPPGGRAVLGLPAKLAFLTLFATAVCVMALALFADNRIQASASSRATDRATDAARSVSSGLTESDFQSPDDEFGQQLGDRLEQLRSADEDLRQIVLFSSGGAGRVNAVQTTDGAREDAFGAAARAAVRTGRPASEQDGDRTRVAWPMTFADGKVGGVIAVEYSSREAMATARDARRKLLLGSLIGGSLLGVLLLMILRRELFRPLEEMRRVMAQIRGGARGVRIGWSRSDELGAVADDFDSMVAELEAAQAELARYVNKDPLTGLLTREAFTDRFSGELTRARREGYPISLLAIDIDDLAELNRTHDEHAGDQVLAAVGEVIGGCTRPTDASGRTGGDNFLVALVGADASQAAVVIQRIRNEIGQRVGVGPERTRVTCSYGVAEYPTHAVDQLALERMAEAACENAHRDGRDRAIAFGPAGGYVDALTLVPDSERQPDRPTGERELASTVHALARALDGIDPALGGGAHSQRVARYAAAIARDLGLGDSQLRELRSAAVLHDVGKVAVPPAILRTAEKELDERQRGALQYHAWVSRTMIAGAGLASVADMVFHLPERWDGTGYPERLREDQIPLSSRILHAAEVLDQLTSGVMGTALDAHAAAGELKRRAGSELDPDVAVRLARLVREEGLLGPEQRSGSGDDLADAA